MRMNSPRCEILYSRGAEAMDGIRDQRFRGGEKKLWETRKGKWAKKKESKGGGADGKKRNEERRVSPSPVVNCQSEADDWR